MINSITNWIIANYIELAGFIAALIYLFFSIKENKWLWPWGIIASAAYIFVYYQSGFYADMSLNIYYVIISIYGWIQWSSKKYGVDKKAELPVSSLTKKGWLYTMISGSVIWIIIYFILKTYTNSTVPLGDAFTTAFSIVATYLLAKKVIDQWLLWIVIDLVSLLLYLDKGLYLTVVLFAIYTTMAIVGYREWKKKLN